MAKQIRVHYSVSNGGDGSAYPVFFATSTEANTHQNKENENGDGWGESCTGTLNITIEEDGSFTIPQRSLGMMEDEPWDDIYPEGFNKDSKRQLEVIER